MVSKEKLECLEDSLYREYSKDIVVYTLKEIVKSIGDVDLANRIIQECSGCSNETLLED